MYQFPASHDELIEYENYKLSPPSDNSYSRHAQLDNLSFSLSQKPEKQTIEPISLQFLNPPALMPGPHPKAQSMPPRIGSPKPRQSEYTPKITKGFVSTSDKNIYANYSGYLLRYMLHYSEGHSFSDTTTTARAISQLESRPLIVLTSTETGTLQNLLDKRRKGRAKNTLAIRKKDWLNILRRAECGNIRKLYGQVSEACQPVMDLLESQKMSFTGKLGVLKNLDRLELRGMLGEAEK